MALDTTPTGSIRPGITTEKHAATPSFRGKTVAILESRRGVELAQIIENYGGVAYHAPALREEPIEDLAQIAAFLDDLQRVSLDVIVFQTGVGTRALLQGVERLGRRDELHAALSQALVVARGPKPTAVLKEHAVRIDRRAAEPYTTVEVLAALKPHEFTGKMVAVQQYGEANADLVTALVARGAKVREVEVYRWALPEDLSPLEKFLADLPGGGIAGLVVTSQVQVRHLFLVATRLGVASKLAEILRRSTVVAAVGPVAARSLVEHAIAVDLEPSHPKMGPLIRELAALLERRELATLKEGIQK